MKMEQGEHSFTYMCDFSISNSWVDLMLWMPNFAVTCHGSVGHLTHLELNVL